MLLEEFRGSSLLHRFCDLEHISNGFILLDSKCCEYTDDQQQQKKAFCIATAWKLNE